MIPIKSPPVKKAVFFLTGSLLGLAILAIFAFFAFEREYQNRVYPGVFINNFEASGKTRQEVEEAFETFNLPFKEIKITLQFESYIATISGEQLNLGLNSKLASDQAFSLGRTGHLSTDTFFKLRSFLYRLRITDYELPITILSPALTYDSTIIEETLNDLALRIDIEAVEPLFELNQKTGKVTAFRLGKEGRKLNREKTVQLFIRSLQNLHTFQPSEVEPLRESSSINLVVKTVQPKVTTAEADKLGVIQLLGRGVSFFAGSALERIHNLTLSSSLLHGQLIAPGETFSFNQAVGDISAATGYRRAYIIKNGRTILDDGGGVCQVSTTLFRAVLNAGLPVIKRHAHSYRVSYYEQGGFKPGLDATVFSPNVDFQFQNDTPGYILIQAKRDPSLKKLTFELYGTADGRRSEILNHKVWEQKPPPPPLYQDDPTLPAGTVKQVDWEAWGAKASFDYKVTRGEEILFEKTFYSNFQPWQAVFLRGISL